MGRKSRNKTLSKTKYLFCEGSTECTYFKMLRKKYRCPVRVKVQESGNTDPIGIVNFAERSLNKLSEKDKKSAESAYVFFDKDDNSMEAIHKACREAKNCRYNLNVVYSNINFEVWLLNHFEDDALLKERTREKLYTELGNLMEFKDSYINHKKDPAIGELLEDRVNFAMKNIPTFCSKMKPINFKIEPYTNVGASIKEIFDKDSDF